MNNIIFKTILLKGEAGNDIQSVEKTDTSGLVDTYTITLTDGSTTTFDVTNGKSIVSIEKTSSAGYVDTYTITYNDGTTDTFDITLATITVDDALSDSSTNPVENRVVTDALNNKSNNSNLATVESGTTASQAYIVDDYLVYNGQLCKVTSAIALGDTLTVGTNIEVTTLTNDILLSFVAISSSTGTFGSQLAEIKSAYEALSEQRKMRAIIRRGTSEYHVTAINAGEFGKTTVQATYATIACLNLNASTVRYAEITSSGITLGNNTDKPSNEAFALYA